MSQTQPTTAAPSRFQAMFDAALKSYQKQTKKDLLAHPLASQLQSCHSTRDILVVLQDQVQQFDKSRSGDERLTKWLTPTVNVLCAFSAVVSGGVGLVSLDTRVDVTLQASSDIYSAGIFACRYNLCGRRCLHFSKYPIYFSGGESFSRSWSYRWLKMLRRVKMLSQSYSNASDISLHGSKPIPS